MKRILERTDITETDLELLSTPEQALILRCNRRDARTPQQCCKRVRNSSRPPVTAGRRTGRRERAGGRRDPAGLRVCVLLPGNAEVSLTPGEAGRPINCHIAKGAQETAFSARCT
ncbi:unnamed protein product [Sphagnum jensenii]|uniref:Uncharacterized protein n=1 Tax=Sphagnum jensenii TaxID=128206 RepID=A0ABP1AC81_9BRYO